MSNSSKYVVMDNMILILILMHLDYSAIAHRTELYIG